MSKSDKKQQLEPIDKDTRTIDNETYEKELRKLQIELVKLQS